MRIIVALLALTAFLVGAAPRALAEEGDDASASPPGVTGGPAHGQAPAPGGSVAPAAPGDDSTQLGAPESEAARPEANPDPRDPSEPAASGDDVLPHREADQVGGGVEVELLHDPLAVRLDGVDADREDASDLAVHLALGDELQDFALAVREQREIILEGPSVLVFDVVLEEDLRDHGAEGGLAACDRLHRLQKLQALRVLEEVAGRSSP